MEISDNIIKFFNDPIINKPLTDKEYIELMKFDEPREEIPIEQIEFRIETAHQIIKELNLENLLNEE